MQLDVSSITTAIQQDDDWDPTRSILVGIMVLYFLIFRKLEIKKFLLDITPLKVLDENQNEFFRLRLTTDTEVMTAQFIANDTEQIIDIENKFTSQKVTI